MSRDATYHRTFLPDGPFEPAPCPGACHKDSPAGDLRFEPATLGPGTPLPALFPRPVAVRKPTLYSRAQARRPAYHFVGGAPVPTWIVDKRDQDFSAHATEWERQWSVVARCGILSGLALFEPVVDANLEIVGHVGSLYGNRLILPSNPFHWGSLSLSDLLEMEVPIFVADTVPDGWVWYDTTQPARIYTVVTDVEGELVSGMAAMDSAPGAISVDGPVDYIQMAIGFGKLGIALTRGLVKSLYRRIAKKVLDGPTKMIAKNAIARELAERAAGRYDPITGMTRKHFDAFAEAADETGLIIAVRHTNPKGIQLIEAGCPGKPKDLEFINTSPTSGVVMANTVDHARKAQQLGYWVVGDKNRVQRLVMKEGKEVLEDVPVKNTFWQLEKGQVIDPKLEKPVVGDYDLMGVIDPKNMGQNIAMVADDFKMLKNFSHPNIDRVATAVNKRIDMPRVLHGAQDQYGGFRGGVTVFRPGGRVIHLKDDLAVKEYYEQVLKRQPAVGTYPRPTGPVPPDELAKKRAALRRGK